MDDRFEVDTDNFRVELNDGVAELVFGAPGIMPLPTSVDIANSPGSGRGLTCIRV